MGGLTGLAGCVSLATIAFLIGVAAMRPPESVVSPADSPVALRTAASPSPFLAASPPQQPRPSSKLAKGRFLVASRDLEDPNFVETVILLLDYSGKSAMGLVINRNTDVRLAELLPEVEGLKNRTETVFAGGPVGRDALMLLVRSREPLEEAKFVFQDVYVTASPNLLEELAAEAGNPRYRAYVGYAGWGAGQLDFEVAMGSWHIVPAQAATVFDSSPAQIWKQLMRSLTMQFASLPLPEAQRRVGRPRVPGKTGIVPAAAPSSRAPVSCYSGELCLGATFRS